VVSQRNAMTGTGVCRQIRLDLGVYLLGAIGAADRSAVDAHLAWCAACRDELAELAGLPGLLSRVTADDADSLVRYHDDGYHAGYESSADLSLHLLLRRAARLRWQRMWPRMAAAAGAGLIAGASAVAALERYRTAPYWTRRALAGRRSGDPP
jgi:predicted anti-sigma-YlaC factor YlaD